jgi:tRNA-Thr(GGU) m(6)t(6)A37 methyltransferase TsaA
MAPSLPGEPSSQRISWSENRLAGHLLTWLHRARRDRLKVHPRGDRRRALTGVFATRAPHRPNPVGLHRVRIRRIEERRLLVGPIEAIDGTPVIDIKPLLRGRGLC